MSKDFLALLKEKGAYLEGHFKLSSGLHSGAYVQCARVLQYPDVAYDLGAYLGEQFKGNRIDVVLSPALGGILIGHEVARELGCRCVFGERENDSMKLRRGFEIYEGEHCLIVEDVITTGKATREMWDIVVNNKGTVAGVGCIVNRSEGFSVSVPLFHIVRLKIENYQPEQCPMCQKNEPITSPGSRWGKK
ncbi:MAG: orotate phosphoribosyltransferase [Candidatus Fischerbacteria bacterium RBG_13_37_8]|uniref:Orotate phosphoribosyltransferase n=1 Tax=Candidatus Fischerbacteria bacterium RBG_13_37_8 TaxID=1817863 RepID=A0A1F5VH62_9BACT|nr:MAG: orotate phosphoribosyltransferase [Candidatus Fischerbacteria bacterium RBG_13_37_8]